MVTQIISRLNPVGRLLLLCAIYSHNLAIARDVNVSQLSFQEALTETDEQEPGFGRFDAFDVVFRRGDRLLVRVSAAIFTPTIILIAPDDSTHLVSPTPINNRSLHYAVEIPIDGDWLLVIRGDSSALGSYTLDAWWADKESLQLSPDADLCDAVNFIIAHANADFFFIRQQDLLRQNSFPPSVTVPGAVASWINDGDEYVARFYRGNDRNRSREVYVTLVGKLKFCNRDTWTQSFQDWHTTDVLSKTREIRFELREKDRDDYRTIQVVSRNLSANPTARNAYEVLLIIKRHH